MWLCSHPRHMVKPSDIWISGCSSAAHSMIRVPIANRHILCFVLAPVFSPGGHSEVLTFGTAMSKGDTVVAGGSTGGRQSESPGWTCTGYYFLAETQSKYILVSSVAWTAVAHVPTCGGIRIYVHIYRLHMYICMYLLRTDHPGWYVCTYNTYNIWGNSRHKSLVGLHRMGVAHTNRFLPQSWFCWGSASRVCQVASTVATNDTCVLIGPE